MKRISAPLIGGLASAILLTLVILPAIYTIWRGVGVRKLTMGSLHKPLGEEEVFVEEDISKPQTADAKG